MTTPRPAARPTPVPTASAHPHAAAPANPADTALETALGNVEQSIATLGHALTLNDVVAVESAAEGLQATMRAAMERFAQVARRGTMPAELRRRFALASGQVAAQREALIRATSAFDQALEILIPRPLANASVYSAQGPSGRGPGRMIARS